jgi:pilus assembly protein TadC
MNKGISHNKESFVKKAIAMIAYGMMTFIMIALFFMILPPSYRIAGYPMATFIQTTPASHI